MQAWGRADRWGVIGLQQIITSNNGGEDVTTRQGHVALVNRHREGGFSTAIAIRRRLAGLPREVRHGERWTIATIKIPTATTAQPLHLQVCNLHLPSAIGHDVDEIETIMRNIEQCQSGKRVARILLGDFNHVLCDHNPHVGQAMRKYFARRISREMSNDYCQIIKPSIEAMHVVAVKTRRLVETGPPTRLYHRRGYQ